MSATCILDDLDRRVVLAMQAGLPLVPRPYHAVAETLGIVPGEVMTRVNALTARGAIRRIGAVPNHYALGYRANGMTVWDVDDGRVDALGSAVGALEYVTHCYRRPRHRPLWPYNLFAMVHGKDRAEVEEKTALIAAILGPAARAREILYSTRILKKTGLRIAG
jgi:DNA-binding Lrp family transcriptional regulator